MLETERLYIRCFKPTDDVAFHHLASNPNITYYAGYKPHANIDITRRCIAGYMFSNEYFAVTLKDGTFIGDIDFYLDSSRKNPEAYQIGFALDTPYHHQGYMQEALKTFIPFVFSKYKIDILGAMHIIGNNHSEHTIKSLGFHYDGITYHYKKMYDGSIVDCKNYSLTHDELERMIKLWKKN